MNSDETWIELSAAVRNVVALLTMNEKAGPDVVGNRAPDPAVSAAGVLTEFEISAAADVPAVGLQAPTAALSGDGVARAESEKETPRVDFRETARRPWNGAIETPATLELGNE